MDNFMVETARICKLREVDSTFRLYSLAYRHPESGPSRGFTFVTLAFFPSFGQKPHTNTPMC
ncbi:hypothetical protein PAXRUDRAFT_826178 [Paxillus rubicundulus Ve08.2h10]|uniref:Uncharacterized protein n=1 Tax=Paxillus rubicundulus Ve08.2h10 TaxID=930991 RepID=A0A0D0DS93_9AGAM|nr:hypothetical protein PAXRUDRAFT_826178 [Paxillus rubicundulus Ve08.2h10]